MPGPSLLRTVGTPHVDVAITAFARDANKPGIAAHLAVLNETSRHVDLDEDLAVLACGWRIANQPRNPLRLSSLVILGVVARMSRCATRSSYWFT